MKILELLSEGFRKITPEEESRAYAVFVVVKYKDGYAATTRDKGAEPIGLPGGKVDPGETPIQAAYRECKEDRDFNASINIKKQGLKILSGLGTNSDIKQKRGKALPLGESTTHEAHPIGSAVGGQFMLSAFPPFKDSKLKKIHKD